MRRLKMTGRFIIILIFILVLNAMDFIDLNKGVTAYIQPQSGLLNTIIALGFTPVLLDLNLEDGWVWVIIFILETVYISIYTFFYLKIRKKQEEEINELYEEIRKKRKFESEIKEEESQNEKQDEGAIQ